MKKIIGIFVCFGVVLIPACKDEPSVVPKEFVYTFSDDAQGWNAFFADYPVGEEVFYEVEFELTALPAPLDANINSLKISGNNHSDDLMSLIYRKFNNLQPNTNYSITFDVDLASNTPTNAVGIGGDPNLFLGAGGVSFEPDRQIDDQNYYRANFNSALQSGLSNEVFKVIGRIGVSDDINTPFKLINRNNLSDQIVIKSNDKGELWLMIGTDSGFEATTTLYYKSIKINIQ